MATKKHTKAKVSKYIQSGNTSITVDFLRIILYEASIAQFMGEILLINFKKSGMTKVGTQIPPIAANITTDIAPKIEACC